MLGYVWSVLNPLLMMVVFTIVFSNLFKFDIPNYPLYLLCGQLIFNFFSDATTQSMNSILMGASLIKKVYLPKYIFPVARVLSSFVMMVFSLLALLIVMVVTGASFHLSLIMLPVAVLYLSVCHGGWTDSVSPDYLFQGYRASVWCLFDRIYVYVTDNLSYFHCA